jgi:hypothetical protein
MPFETRRIMFNYDEILQAILTFGSKYNMSFPEGKIAKITDANPKEYAFNPLKKFRDNEALPIIISFFQEGADHKYVTLTAEFILSALVEYCLDHKIMLPKSAHKEIEVIEFHVALEVGDRDAHTTKTKTGSGLSFDE